jgi:hypothetical protein
MDSSGSEGGREGGLYEKEKDIHFATMVPLY